MFDFTNRFSYAVNNNFRNKCETPDSTPAFPDKQPEKETVVMFHYSIRETPSAPQTNSTSFVTSFGGAR